MRPRSDSRADLLEWVRLKRCPAGATWNKWALLQLLADQIEVLVDGAVGDDEQVGLPAERGVRIGSTISADDECIGSGDGIEELLRRRLSVADDNGILPFG